MICLGIESTAHTFGAGIVKDSIVLSNCKSTYSTESGGIHPREASEHHSKNAVNTIKLALQKAKIGIKDIDLIAFSQGPGIPPCLRIGAVTARMISLTFKKPLVGVNHCIAHLEAGRELTPANDPIMLYVSGGNTQVIGYEKGKYHVFGESTDMALGNLIDSFARLADIGFPGGPEVEEFAKKGKYVELPYSVKGMNVSFGGIYTNLKQKLSSGKHNINDLCYSLQETTFAMLVEVSERALAHCQKKELLLTGGVAANKRLQQMCKIMCRERGVSFYTLPLELAGDNGAMIAINGIQLFKTSKPLKIKDSEIKQKWRADEVKITWR